jgi:hypothetical protein
LGQSGDESPQSKKGGTVQRLWVALRCFWLVLTDRSSAEKVTALLKPAELPATPPPEPLPTGAIELLALFQREGRLVDFLRENIEGYTDEQVGAAVRDIHRGCRQALDECVQLKAILDREEESRVEVPPGFDPSEIRLTGNVHGDPPFHGTLKHHGWLVQKIKFTESVVGNARVVAPAEVEV